MIFVVADSKANPRIAQEIACSKTQKDKVYHIISEITDDFMCSPFKYPGNFDPFIESLKETRHTNWQNSWDELYVSIFGFLLIRNFNCWTKRCPTALEKFTHVQFDGISTRILVLGRVGQLTEYWNTLEVTRFFED